MIDYSIIDFTALRKTTYLPLSNTSQTCKCVCVRVRTCPTNYCIKQVIALITLEWERVD